ncbi:MAG: DUF4123 domain-containing protein [Paracoccus sp. (in: a-proteobacteria)]
MTSRGQEFIPRQLLLDQLAGRGPVIALLDAANLPGLPERIESRRVEALSLFQGKSAEELRDVAPYLVRMDPDSPLMRDFLNSHDVPWAMWGKRPGLLILSDLDLEALQKHFRRFLRVQTERGTFFFRFWEPASAAAYFEAIEDSPDRGRWFFPREGGQIDAIMAPDAAQDRLQSFAVKGERPENPDWESRPFTLLPDELEAMRGTRTEQNLRQMVTLMAETFPALAARMSPADMDKAVRRSVSRSAELGIRQRNNAFRVAAWDLHSGGKFEDGDPGGELRRILTADLGETEKMHRLAERISRLSPANS